MIYPTLKKETPRPENAIALITSSLREASQLSKTTAIISEALTEYKGVELSEKGK
jgi:hypothetical protein